MIAWIILIGGLCILIIVPARIFGACCGLVARVLARPKL